MVARLSSSVKGPVRGHPRPIQNHVSSRFFTMLTFSQILCLHDDASSTSYCVQSRIPPADVSGSHLVNVTVTWPPRCTLIISCGLSFLAEFGCQSHFIIWFGGWCECSSDLEVCHLRLRCSEFQWRKTYWAEMLFACSPQRLVCMGGVEENHGENVLALCCRLRSLGAKSGAMS